MSEPMGAVNMTDYKSAEPLISGSVSVASMTPEERISGLSEELRGSVRKIGDLEGERRTAKDVIYNLITDLEKTAVGKGRIQRNCDRLAEDNTRLYKIQRAKNEEIHKLRKEVESWKRQAEVHRQQRDYEMTQPAVAPEERKKRPASYGKLRPKAHWGKLPEDMNDCEDREEVENG